MPPQSEKWRGHCPPAPGSAAYDGGGVLHLLPPKLRRSMFCALSQNYQHLVEKYYMYLYGKLSKKLKNSIKI